ncbi:MAG: hypothetical protein GX094_04715 [Clostridiales bacterium]|nr:hypothetical protein [Clostridiales bacterium]
MSEETCRRRLKRSESFLGIHFDFHAGNDCTEIGKNTTREIIENIIKRVKPDYIQCDCKGHRGLSSYPTKVGNQAPGIIGDPLKIWRDVTAEYGVALYMHYSGVWDTEAIKHHPEWARVDENGNIDPNNTSTFGPYVDELLIPQLKELSDEYGVDGVWVDGECWATCHDYREEVIKAFREKTGIREIPRKPEDPYYYEFSEFCREAFRRYLKHYVDEMHKHNPDFQIASNWAYSSFMPEPVNVDVDYISGDYTLQNSVNSARFEGRCMAPQGKPWDLMAWAFSSRFREGGASTKTPIQLMQEAAIVLSLGGGFQAYFKQKRDGSISDWEMGVMEKVAEFCRARQKVCHKAKAVPQIALLNSSADYYRKCKRLFSPWHGEFIPIQGILRNLLENQYCVEILSEHHLNDKMDEYPLIIVPECRYLEQDFIQKLTEYVRNGGNLLVIGPTAAALFEEQLGIRLEGEIQSEAVKWLSYNGFMSGFKTDFQKVTLKEGAKAIGELYDGNDTKGKYDIAASINSYEKGKIAGIYMNIGERYVKAATSLSREFLGGIVRELFPEPVVRVWGSHNVDVTLNRTADGRLAINLVNTSGPHADENVYVYDEVPPVGPLYVSVRVGNRKPSRVTLEPYGRELPYIWEDECVKIVLPRLELHDIIVID